MKAREARRKVVVPARLNAGPRWVDAVILNISSRGLLVRCDTAMEPGTYVDIRRGRQVIIGRAVWSDGHQFGVRTQDRVDIDALLGELSRPSSADGAAARHGAPAHRERRAEPRRATAADVAARSRRQSALFQYALAAAAVLIAAAFAASIVHDLLTRSLGAVTAHL